MSHNLYIGASLFLLIDMYISIKDIIVSYFNSFIMFLYQDYLQENIKNILSNRVTKYPDF